MTRILVTAIAFLALAGPAQADRSAGKALRKEIKALNKSPAVRDKAAHIPEGKALILYRTADRGQAGTGNTAVLLTRKGVKVGLARWTRVEKTYSREVASNWYSRTYSKEIDVHWYLGWKTPLFQRRKLANRLADAGLRPPTLRQAARDVQLKELAGPEIVTPNDHFRLTSLWD